MPISQETNLISKQLLYNLNYVQKHSFNSYNNTTEWDCYN